jgi:hypothetical protein
VLLQGDNHLIFRIPHYFAKCVAIVMLYCLSAILYGADGDQIIRVIIIILDIHRSRNGGNVCIRLQLLTYNPFRSHLVLSIRLSLMSSPAHSIHAASASPMPEGVTDPNYKPLPGRLGNLTVQQLHTLEKFKKELQDEGHFVPERMHDAMLLRYVFWWPHILFCSAGIPFRHVVRRDSGHNCG